MHIAWVFPVLCSVQHSTFEEKNLFYLNGNCYSPASCAVIAFCGCSDPYFNPVGSFFQALLHGKFTSRRNCDRRRSGKLLVGQFTLAVYRGSKCKCLCFLLNSCICESFAAHLRFDGRSGFGSFNCNNFCCTLISGCSLCCDGDLHSAGSLDGNLTLAVYCGDLCIGRLVSQSALGFCSKGECLVTIFLGNNTFAVLHRNGDGLCFHLDKFCLCSGKRFCRFGYLCVRKVFTIQDFLCGCDGCFVSLVGCCCVIGYFYLFGCCNGGFQSVDGSLCSYRLKSGYCIVECFDLLFGDILIDCSIQCVVEIFCCFVACLCVSRSIQSLPLCKQKHPELQKLSYFYRNL